MKSKRVFRDRLGGVHRARISLRETAYNVVTTRRMADVAAAHHGLTALDGVWIPQSKLNVPTPGASARKNRAPTTAESLFRTPQAPYPQRIALAPSLLPEEGCCAARAPDF